MVTVRLFAMLKTLAGREVFELPVNGRTTVGALLDQLNGEAPQVVALIREKKVMLSVNEEFAGEETAVRDGDVIGVLPPFSGGTHCCDPHPTLLPDGEKERLRGEGNDMVRIQTEDFAIEAEITRVKAASTRIGGIVVFLGTARDFSQGRRIQGITFDHYPGMAEKKLQEIRERALKAFDIVEVAILHRVGEMAIGDNLVLIIVGAEHRAEAFRACSWCITELKQITPLWKMEHTPEGEHWVVEHP